MGAHVPKANADFPIWILFHACFCLMLILFRNSDWKFTRLTYAILQLNYSIRNVYPILSTWKSWGIKTQRTNSIYNVSCRFCFLCRRHPLVSQYWNRTKLVVLHSIRIRKHSSLISGTCLSNSWPLLNCSRNRGRFALLSKSRIIYERNRQDKRDRHHHQGKASSNERQPKTKIIQWEHKDQ